MSCSDFRISQRYLVEKNARVEWLLQIRYRTERPYFFSRASFAVLFFFSYGVTECKLRLRSVNPAEFPVEFWIPLDDQHPVEFKIPLDGKFVFAERAWRISSTGFSNSTGWLASSGIRKSSGWSTSEAFGECMIQMSQCHRCDSMTRVVVKFLWSSNIISI